MKILSIETSCDETSCAVVEDGRTVLSNVVASQIDAHKIYGGVVPEIASRLHCESIIGVCEQALVEAFKDKTDKDVSDTKILLDEIDAIAVTFAPGLIGALLVGVNFAKGLALTLGKPLIPVHHIRGHIASNYIQNLDLKPEFLALVVSGGHTTLTRVKGYTDFNVIGSTLDDAAGEAFDKAARVMGLPYPGGAYIGKLSKGGDIDKYPLPRPKTEHKYDFSFSGLKTSVINLVHNSKQSGRDIDLSSLAASFQYTVCEILVNKTILCANELGIKRIALAGGVAANEHLRKTLNEKCLENSINLYSPALEFCGDNAAMIGCQAYYEFLEGNIADSSLNAYATKEVRSTI